MHLNSHEKDVIKRVLGGDAIHLIEQEPGLPHRGIVSNDDTIAALTNAEAARVLQACIVGMAMAFDDLRTLAERASAVGREIMVRVPADARPQRPQPEPEKPKDAEISDGLVIRIKPDPVIRHFIQQGKTPEYIAERLNGTKHPTLPHERNWTATQVLERVESMGLLGQVYSPVSNTRKPKRQTRNYDNVSAKAKQMILEAKQQGIVQRQIVEQLNEAGELIDGTPWDVTTMNNYYTTRLKK